MFSLNVGWLVWIVLFVSFVNTLGVALISAVGQNYDPGWSQGGSPSVSTSTPVLVLSCFRASGAARPTLVYLDTTVLARGKR